MVPVLTAAEMREADRRTIDEVGLPGAVLMENAGTAVAQAIRERYGQARRILVLCGKGNNGGDGFVVARRLLDLRPVVFLAGSRNEVKGDARLHMGAFERCGGVLTEIADGEAWERARHELVTADLVVDALLGTGLRQAPVGLMAQLIADIGAERRGRSVPVVAVDIPSGISSDGGDLSWETLDASLTVTFAAPKYGHVLPPACDRIGELAVVDIGIPSSAIAAASPSLWLLQAQDPAAAYPSRPRHAHKGTFGHVLIVGGSVGKTGATVLAGQAALFSGAGLVTVATPAPALALVAPCRAEIMTEPLPVGGAGTLDADGVERALSLAQSRDAVVLGPGLGQEAGTREFVRRFVRDYTGPLLVDADGLNALAPLEPRVEAATDSLRRDGPTVITPHPGEMARLVGTTSQEVQRRRLEMARALAVETGAVVVLKGQRTVIADAQGRAAVNPTGNPGMATGGTGDVLAGMIGALLARGCEPWISATAAVYLHGQAGDAAAERKGEESMVAGDLLEELSQTLRTLEVARP